MTGDTAKLARELGQAESCASLVVLPGLSPEASQAREPVSIPRQQQQRISAVAHHRHKRDTNARRTMPSAIQVAGPIAARRDPVDRRRRCPGRQPRRPGTDDLLASSSSAAAGISASSVAQRGDVVSAPSAVRSLAPRLARRPAGRPAEAERACPPGAAGHAQGHPDGRHQALDDRRAQPVDDARRATPARSASSRTSRRSW